MALSLSNNKKHSSSSMTAAAAPPTFKNHDDHTSESLPAANNHDDRQNDEDADSSSPDLMEEDNGDNRGMTSMSMSENTFVRALEEGLQSLRAEEEAARKSQGRRRLLGGIRRNKKNKGGHGRLSKRTRATTTGGLFSGPNDHSPGSSCRSMNTTGGDDHSRLSGYGSNGNNLFSSKWILTLLIVLLGGAASAAFMAFGFHATNTDMEGRFESSAESITYHVESAWTTYEMFALWIHESCHKHIEPNPQVDPLEAGLAAHLGYCSRAEFRRLYEYIASQGVNFLAAQLLRNITHEYRDMLESEAQAYYQTHYPHVNYRGITEQVFRPDGSGFDLIYREQHPYYIPIHYVEPVQGNEVILDIDKMATVSSNNVLQALEFGQPFLSPRLRLIQETTDAYGVILAHPGVSTSIEQTTNNNLNNTTTTTPRRRTNSVAQIVIRLPSLLEYALQSANEDKDVYLYDSTDSPPMFLGALRVETATSSSSSSSSNNNNDDNAFTLLPEVELSEIPRPDHSRYFERKLEVAGRQWTIIVVSTAHQSDLLFVILGGTIIFAAALFCAAWFHSHLSRIAKLNKIKSARQAEKAEIAKIQAMRERELNEFIAHEVRNPLSSAISALSFVSAGVSEHVPDPTHKQSILEDVGIMDASLAFINELLRNMLDIHRARGRQIKLNLSPVDIRRDIMEPVAAILFMRGAKVAIEVDCPPDFAVNGDRMRLKQIALNLSANSTKFVERGYIRLRGEVVNGSVELSVEDSGPGIPLEKRHRLFAKFQESLDSLNQGTGIGLAVCKNLCELMGADIALDESFDSGVEGCPGTRFVLRLNQPALEIEKSLEPEQATTTTTTNRPSISDGEAAAKAVMCELGGAAAESSDLPETLSVLVVDDDTMIRKMFRRAALRVAPKWEIEEASNGETALVITESRNFDVIFLDQYMASVEKQLLGTETARALRSKGVESIICGLSANDMELQFLESGADTFMMKPFPCKKDAMAQAFMEVLRNGRRQFAGHLDEKKE